MGYTIQLLDKNGTILPIEYVVSFSGSQTCLDTDRAEMLMTYNYSNTLAQGFHYDHNRHKSGIRWLNGQLAKDTVQKLSQAILRLGIKCSEDYFTATDGNVGFSLWVLLGWALEHPCGKWRVLN